MRMLMSFVLSCLCLYLLYILIKFFHKVWWTPIRLQYLMGKQGIKGPCYRFIRGNIKELIDMRKESLSKPIDLSNHIFPRIQPHIYSWVKLYGMNVLSWNGPQAQLFVTEPELIKEIMNNKDGGYPKPEAPLYVRNLFGDGLATSKSEKWAKARKLANYAFHGDSLKSMIPEMISCTEVMLERWNSHVGKEIEIYEEFRLLTSEVISKTAFGSSYLQGKNMFEMLTKMVVLSSRNVHRIRFPGIISKNFKSGDDKESEKLVKGIRDSVMEMIKKREESTVVSEQVGNFGRDFLGLLLQANHDADDSHKISVQDVIDECKTFYIAGQETTTSLLVWTVLLLAIHTDWQEQARKEVLELFGQGVPISDAISRLKIMSMILHESLRLYPPIVGVMRKVEREVRIGKIILPANIDLYISTLAPHHDPHTWGEDVHLFKPERFLGGVSKSTKNNLAAFFPFGLGPRTCVGSSFATAEATIALSMILQRYKFTISPSYVHSPFQLLTIRPQHGVQILLRPL